MQQSSSALTLDGALAKCVGTQAIVVSHIVRWGRNDSHQAVEQH